ncbi:MAG: ABC transporter permease [Cyclobacteriaceae bacterium]|nr:ABC transporter permease [Cyclobacteriaceae bacterium]
MFRNYLKTALRNLRRETSNTVLNLLGLTLGIGAGLILFLLVRYHNSFDTFHAKRDRIYRINTSSRGNQGDDFTSGVPAVLPEAFRLDFPEAEEVTFTSYRNGGLVTIRTGAGEPKKYSEERGISFVQPNFFRIFDRPVLAGNIDKALDEPNEAVISRSMSQKYFGREDALGEVLQYDNRDYKVTTIMEDAPSNTDLPISIMLSYVTIKKELDEHGWNSIWSDEHCYFLLKEGAQVSAIEARIPAFVKKYMGDDNRANRSHVIQPLSEIHFDDRFGNYNYNTVSRSMLLSLSVIAIFLLLTACINFINLSTAEAVKRSKEVGIRKSLGSTRRQLVTQFLGETTLVTLTAAVLAVGMAELALPFLNSFLELKLVLTFNDTITWSFLLGVIGVVSLISGLYPSLVVSSFSPVLALKNKMSNKHSSGFMLRRGLVVTQFFISQFLVIATLVMIAQTNYFRNKDLGFRKDAIVTVPIPVSETPATGETAQGSKMRTLRDGIMRLPGVETASLSNTPPASGSVSGTGFSIDGSEDFYECQVKTIDSHYLDLFGLPLVAGANLLDLDTAQGFLVNEKLAAMTGHTNPADIVGKRIRMWGKILPVAGVVKDFHTMSLHAPIEATVLLNRIRNYRTLSVRVRPTEMQSTLDEIKNQWEAAYPEHIFSYEFMDESIREFYQTESRNAVLLSLFTSLAIFIGCLGLFGLASFMANQKTKEIGIRKVLGASVENILFIFSREFVVLIAVGFVIAAPLAWWGMNKYLDEFAYKITLGPGLFLAGLGLTLFVAMVTVGYRSIRAAMVNPVQSLRSE